jgi:hypothetical protein
MAGKIKILFLAADPFEDRAPLRLAEEARAITEAIERGAEGSALEIAHCWAVRTGDLQRALLKHRPQIVHFAGHGSRDDGIHLGDEYGSPRAVGREALGKLFAILKPGPAVVVLNACDTAPMAEAFSGVVDYTVAMNAPLPDSWGVRFAEAFYGALSFGVTVREAFELGVSRLEIDGAPGETIPMLAVREGVDEAQTIASFREQPAVTPAPAASADEGQEISGDSLEYDEVDFNNYRGSGRQVHHFGTMRGRRASFNNNAGPSAA